MNDAWFNANQYAWIPGTLLGVLGGTFGGVVGSLAPMGKGRRLVMAAWWLLVICCAGLLAAGTVAFVAKQPYGVWYGLALPGLLGLILFPALKPTITSAYRMAEERRMQAKDLEP